MTQATAFALKLGSLPPSTVVVQAFKGQEAISDTYRFEIRVETAIPAELFHKCALGSGATLFIRHVETVRQVHGLVTRVRYTGTSSPVSGRPVYTLELVPHAWLLTLRRGSRIWQSLSVRQVIDLVLDENGTERAWDIDTPLPSRQYTTQYEESDWAFVTRLCAENGIAFFFRHPSLPITPELERLLFSANAGSTSLVEDEDAIIAAIGVPGPSRPPRSNERLVFSSLRSYEQVSGAAIAYAQGGALAADRDYVFRFGRGRGITPETARFREFDWKRPLLALECESTVTPPDGAANLDALEVFEHHAHDLDPDVPHLLREAERRLIGLRRRATRSKGRSSSVRLVPGCAFTLEDHPSDNGTYAVISVKHAGSHGGATGESAAYVNRFDVVSGDVPYLPAHVPRSMVHGVLTGIVAGPEPEEIHVNSSGQIKVRFHWDRRTGVAEPSCWLRCMQAWSGTGFGAQFIPRIGTEVVVSFERGDPDRPLVMGCVYNGVSPVPFDLPRDRTRSGFRTRSSPAGTGYNELSFQDAVGAERVHLRAERDLEFVVLHDRSAIVQNDDRLLVTGSRHEEVQSTRHTRVDGDSRLVVGGDRHERVEGTDFADLKDVVTGIEGGRTTTISRDEDTHVAGRRRAKIGGDDAAEIAGNLALVVGASETDRSATLTVQGSASAAASKGIDISSDKEIVLRVGNNFLRVSSSGIEIAGDRVTLRSDHARILVEGDDIKTKADGDVQAIGQRIVLKSSGASLGLTSEVNARGARVLLNSPSQATDAIEADDPRVTRIELVDQDGAPVPFQPYRVRSQDGPEIMGFLDQEGKADILIDAADEIIFPELPSVGRQ